MTGPVRSAPSGRSDPVGGSVAERLDVPGADELDLGAAPRRRRPVPRPALLVLAAALAVAAVVLLAWHPWTTPAPTARPAAPPSAPAGGGDDGPFLDRSGSAYALESPDGAGGVRTVPLVPDPAAVAAVADRLPGLAGVEGGASTDPDEHYGVYLTGFYPGPAAVPLTVTVVAVRSPGTTFGTDHLAVSSRTGRLYDLRAESAAFTGAGWWVHVVVTGTGDDVDLRPLLPALDALVLDPRLAT